MLRLANALQHMAAGLLEGKRTLEAKVAERTLALQQLNERLETLARTDTLTQIANRLAGNERLALEFSRFKRSGSAYTVLIMDIDFFKRVNDTHGHPAGDAVRRTERRSSAAPCGAPTSSPASAGRSSWYCYR